MVLISKGFRAFIRHLMVIECEYCGGKFKRKSILAKHQKNAKYCLKLQQHSSPEPEKETSFTCSGCPKVFGRLFNLKRHEKSCPGLKYKQPEQPKTDRNVIIQGSITQDTIQKHLDHLSLNYIADGARGLANYANVYPFNGMVICTDYSRKKFLYSIDDMVVNDTGSVLTQQFFQAIIDKSRQIISEEYNCIQEKVYDISSGHGVCSETIDELLKRSTELQKTIALCEQAANGHTNSLTVEFIKHFSRLL